MKKLFFASLLAFAFNHMSAQQTFQANDFKIGMYGFSYMTNVPWDPNSNNLVAIQTPVYNGYPSSVLNVLKEDGFNIVQTYQPGTYHTAETEIASITQLFKNNGMQVLYTNRDWYKPTAITYSVWNPVVKDTLYSTTGINIYDNSDDTLPRYNDPTNLMKVRPNFLNMINTVYSDLNFSATIWGH